MTSHLLLNLRPSSLAIALGIAAILTPSAHSFSASQTAASPAVGDGIPVIENYTTKDYNSSGQVWAIAQDKQGVMYFGVSAGQVIQFDGVSWRKIPLGSSVVRSFSMDDSGRMWLGGNATLGYLAPDGTGTLEFKSLLDQVPTTRRRLPSWLRITTPRRWTSLVDLVGVRIEPGLPSIR